LEDNLQAFRFQHFCNTVGAIAQLQSLRRLRVSDDVDAYAGYAVQDRLQFLPRTDYRCACVLPVQNPIPQHGVFPGNRQILQAIVYLSQVVRLYDGILGNHNIRRAKVESSDEQRRAFAAQLEIAARAGRPVVVHAREADDDIAAMLRDARSPVVLHSYSSGPAVFQVGLDLGAYFSFSGMVTFRNWALTDCVRACPAERLLVETDSPYLAPVPHRDRRNEPAFVGEVARRVAELRGETFESIARQTTANAARCFGERLLREAVPRA